MKKFILFVFLFRALVPGTQTVQNFQLTAFEDGSAVMSDGSLLPFWGFRLSGGGGAMFPGPWLVVNEGDSVRVRLENAGDRPHTFHLDEPGASLGEPTNPLVVQPGGANVFAFRAGQAGDYRYHCGLQNSLHNQLGMVGLLTIRAAGGVKKVYSGGPGFFVDYHWLLGEFDRERNLDPEPPGGPMPYAPDYFFINGKWGDALGDYLGDVAIFSALDQLPVYLNVSNTGAGKKEVVFPPLVLASVVLENGKPQNPPRPLDTLRLASGEGFGLLLQPKQNGTDSIRVNSFAAGSGDFLGQNVAAIYILHHSAVTEPGATAATAFQILPNPVGDFLELRFLTEVPNSPLNLEIFTKSGQCVLRCRALPDRPVAVWDLAPGVYFLKIATTNGSQSFVATQSFFKS